MEGEHGEEGEGERRGGSNMERSGIEIWKGKMGGRRGRGKDQTWREEWIMPPAKRKGIKHGEKSGVECLKEKSLGLGIQMWSGSGQNPSCKKSWKSSKLDFCEPKLSDGNIHSTCQSKCQKPRVRAQADLRNAEETCSGSTMNRVRTRSFQPQSSCKILAAIWLWVKTNGTISG